MLTAYWQCWMCMYSWEPEYSPALTGLQYHATNHIFLAVQTAMGTGLHPPQLLMVWDTKQYPPPFNLIHSVCLTRETLHIYTGMDMVVFAILRSELVCVFPVASLSPYLSLREAKAVRDFKKQCERGVSVNQQVLIRRGKMEPKAAPESHSAVSFKILLCLFQKPDLGTLPSYSPWGWIITLHNFLRIRRYKSLRLSYLYIGSQHQLQ